MRNKTAVSATLGLSLCGWFQTLPLQAQQPAAPQKQIVYVAATKENYLQFAGEMETMLRRDVLDVWFPRTVDNVNGGFNSNFTRDWQPNGTQGKFSVFQGRQTWVASQIAMRRPDMKDKFLPIARHGVEYLNNVLWDKQDGGFFWGLQDDGKISPVYTDGKHLYGMSFAIYGASAAYQATHDPKALDLAQRGFHWIEAHAHDDKNTGYFEWLTRDGKPIPAHPKTGKVEGLPVALFPIGYKSMNTHIHLLEAYSQLYEVWKDEALRKRLQELLEIIRDKVCVEPGAMNLYFTNAWQPIPDHDSYGHDVETAYLMLEAEDVLGVKHDPRTERMAKMLVDHALNYGWDETYGGFYRDGTTIGKTEDKLKEWWVQYEGLNALLIMHEKYGRQSDAYFKAFQLQWQFIKEYQIDSEYRGVYELVGIDNKPTTETKGRIWKGSYHDGRALLNVEDRLKKLAENGAKQ
jgi:mannobiose 2-epimerase